MQVWLQFLPPPNHRHLRLLLPNFLPVILHLCTTNLLEVILLIQITEVEVIHLTIEEDHLLITVVGLLQITEVGLLLITEVDHLQIIEVDPLQIIEVDPLQIIEDLHLQIIIDLILLLLIIEVTMDHVVLLMMVTEAEVTMVLHLIVVLIIEVHLQEVLPQMMVIEDLLHIGIHHIIDLQDQGEVIMVADIE